MLLISWPLRWQVVPSSPHGPSPHQDALHEFSRTNSTMLVDLVPVLQRLCREHSVEEIYLDEVHTTALTNVEIGNHVAGAIDRWLMSKN